MSSTRLFCFTRFSSFKHHNQLPYHDTMRTLLTSCHGVQSRNWNAGSITASPCKLPQVHAFQVKDRLLPKRILFPMSSVGILGNRLFWSNSGSKTSQVLDKLSTPALPVDSSLPGSGGSGNSGNELAEILGRAYNSVGEGLLKAKEVAREASSELTPYVQQVFDSQPYLRDVIIPIGGTLGATLLAWLVMPKLLRRVYRYSMAGPLPRLLGTSSQVQIPYERSLWSALEDPARYLVTFLAFSQLAAVIVPSISIYLSQAWRGAFILSFVWFLHRWKQNVISRALTFQAVSAIDREKLMAVDNISSVGLLVLGVMGFAEACGIAVQSILTVGGIGGVATAFAAKDILGNVLNGLSLQFSKPFSIGDTIKAGSIEGQVMEIGLTTTSLLNAEKFPVTVPNSLFSSQVIVNKSRAQWRSFVSKIPLRVTDVEMVPLVSDDIKSMLRSHPKVFLEKDAPYCFLSRIENSYAEFTVGCNVVKMGKEELYVTQQDILLQAVKIIKNHGAELGSTPCDYNCP